MSFYKRIGIDLIVGAGADSRVRVSVTDTTSSYLDDKISATDGKITKQILNVSSNETLDLSVDDSKIDHNALLNFSALEHRVQNDAVTTSTTLWSSSKTQTELDTKVDELGAVTDNRLVRTDGTTGKTIQESGITVSDTDEISGVETIDVATEVTIAGTNVKASIDELYSRDSAGDIYETSFTIANNQAVAASVTGFAFAGTVRTFEALASVAIDADVDLYENFILRGINKGASWDISITSVGDDSAINLDITSGGQVTYTSGNYTGFVSGTFKFRAISLGV